MNENTTDLWMPAEGDFVKDGLTCGVITGRGTLRYGRRELPAYVVQVASGRTVLMLAQDTQVVAYSYDGAPGERRRAAYYQWVRATAPGLVEVAA